MTTAIDRLAVMLDPRFDPEVYPVAAEASRLGARELLTATLTDPDDPNWLTEELRRHTFLRSDRFGTEPEGWYCDGCGAFVEPISSTKTGGEVFAAHQIKAVLAAILGDAT